MGIFAGLVVGSLFFGLAEKSHAQATTIAITNHDFETGGLSDNSNSAFPGVIPAGWQAVPGAAPVGDFYGYYNPVDDPGGYVSGVSGSPGVTGTMAGPNVFYFGTAVDGQGIQQTLATTFALNTDYTLTVARGTRNSIFNNSLRMLLYAGSTVLASRDVAPEPAGSRGTFLDYSVTYTANITNSSANVGLVGQPLVIRFLEIDNPGNPQAEVDIDNVRLTSSGADTDGDGLSDAREALLGTDPNKADTDGDGLNDNVETGTGIFVAAPGGAERPVTFTIVTNKITDGQAGTTSLVSTNGGSMSGKIMYGAVEAGEWFLSDFRFVRKANSAAMTLAGANFASSGTTTTNPYGRAGVGVDMGNGGTEPSGIMKFSYNVQVSMKPGYRASNIFFLGKNPAVNRSYGPQSNNVVGSIQATGFAGTGTVRNPSNNLVTPDGTTFSSGQLLSAYYAPTPATQNSGAGDYSGNAIAWALEVPAADPVGFLVDFTAGTRSAASEGTAFSVQVFQEDTGTSPLLADSDNDGLTDSEEITIGTNPNLADTDGDGVNDGTEVTAGTFPLSYVIGSDGANSNNATVFTGTNDLVKIGSNEVTLTAVNSYSGGTFIASGTLALNGSGTAGSGEIKNQSVLRLNSYTANSSTLTNLVSGTGSLWAVVNGSNRLTAANSYGGVTRVDSSSSGSRANFILSNSTGPALYNGTNGQIVIGNSVYVQTMANNQLGTNVSVRWNVTNNANYGYFLLMGRDQTVGNLDPGTDAARAVIENTESETGVGNATLTIHQTSDVVFSGYIRNTSTGSGTLGLTKNGSGKLTVAGANITYTGATTIEEGTLVLSNATSFASPITVNSNGIVEVLTGTAIANNITNNGILVFNRSDDFTNSYAISGTGEVKQIGKGTTTLTGTHTYTGPTTISDGVLFVKSGGSINSSTNTVQSGGVLWVNGSVGAVTVESGAKVKGSGAVASLRVNSNGLVKITATNTWNTAGPITLDSGSKIDVADLTLTQQPYVLLSGTSLTGTPTLVGTSGFNVTNTSNTIQLVPTLDSDNDGLTDYQESQLGSNPNLADTDGDGSSDAAEVAAGTNPNQADTDEDGLSDTQEGALGSNPTNPLSMPKTKVVYWGPASGVAAANVPADLPSDIVKISAGENFALALSSAGRVYAWGANESGQTNVPAEALIGVVDILAGGNFAYARKADGSVVGWGSSASITNLPGNIVKMAGWGNQGLLLDSAGRAYQRGPNNLNVTANVNTDSAWQSGVTDIGAARYNHIALKAGAALVVGTPIHNSLVVPAEAQANVKSVIAHGGSTETAILSNNQVVMWGKADSGQISGLRTIVQAGSLPGVSVTRTNSGTANNGWEELVLSQSGSPSIRKFFPTQSYWSGLIDKDGKIWAWGNPANGLPTATVPVAMAANVVQASGGGNFALALVLDQDGDGLADNVETNTGTYVSADNTGTDPAAADTDGDGLNDGVETGTGVFVSATNTGTNPNLADTDGDGLNDGAEVAAGTDPNEPFDRPTQLASGTSHTLYIPVIGDRVLAWGANSVGQCGLGHNTSPVTSGVPVLEAGGAILSNAVAVAAGAQHSLILQVDTNGVRRVFTAGTNPAGQLGLGTNVAAMNRFTPIPGLTNVRSVVSGDAFALARDGDGRIWAWGFNGFGQLGNGNLNSQFQPQAIGGAKRFSFVAAGAEHAVALDTNGVLHTWGRGNYGQLGLGGVQRTNVPSALTLNFTNATNKVIQAGAGLAQTFVLTEEGEVWAFGRNDLGQLGLGTNVILTNVPTRISNAIAANGASVALPEIRRLSVGPRRVMAIARNGTVYGWGYNRFGELGLAPSTNAPLYCEYLPTEVPALYGSLEIAGGAYQTFALDSSGTLLALGFNEGGQLGIGNTDPVSGGPTPTTEAGKSTQTITFNRTNVVGAITVGGSVFLTGTASSALPLVYTVSDTNLASVTSNTVTLLATGTLAITARQPGDSNFNAGAPVTVSNLVIAKPTPSVTWTNPTPITYGTILSGSQLNAEASTPGTFTYTPAAGTVLNAGTNLLSAVFTADDPTNYVSPLTNTVSLVVNKATPTITAPSASAITEGQELGASTLSGGSASVEGTFAWTTPSTVPPASGSYSVTFTPTDAANYETVSVNVAVTVLDPAADEDGDGLSNLQEIEDGTDPFSPAPVVGYLGIVQMYFQDGSGTPGLGLPWRQVGGSNAVAQKVMMAKVSTGLEATKVEVGLEGEAGVTPVATLSTQIPGTLYDEFELAPENELFFATTNAAEANLAVGSYLFQPMAFTNPVAETNSVVWTDQPYPSQAPRVTTDAWSNSALRITNVFVTNTLAWELWSGGGPKDQIRLQFRRQGDATVYTHNLAASETNRVFEPGDFGSTNSVWECSISFLKFSARGALRGKETHFYISTGPDFPAPTAGTDPAFAPATGVYGESFSFGTVAPGGTIQVTGSNLAGVTKASFDLFDTNSGSTYAILDDVTATASSVTIPIPQFQAEGSYQLRYIGGTTPQVLGTITVSGGASPFENNVNLTSINSVISVPMPSAALGPMTLEFWIKPSSSLSSGTYRLVSKNGPTGNSELAIDLNFTSSTVANLSAKVTPTGGFATTASVDLANPLGWTHVAMVISSFSVQLFADGTAGSSFSLTSGLNWSSLQLVFGNGFRGQLDDIRIYSGSRTGTQINADKTGPALSPYETSLKAYYKLDEGMGTSLADATGQNGAATAGNIGWGPGRSPGVWNISHGDYSLQNDGTQLLMELGGMEGTTLYDQIFVRSGAATLDGIVNLMFIGSYTGPVSGSWHTFDLIWAQNGIVFGDNYQLTFNQPGFTVDTSVVQKDGGQLWQATVRQAASQADLEQAAALAQPVMGLAQSPGPAGSVEMLYTYTRPTGGSYVNGQYLVGGVRYEVQVSGDLRSWSPAALEEVAVIPFGAGYEHATVRVVVGGTKAFLKLEVSN